MDRYWVRLITSTSPLNLTPVGGGVLNLITGY